MSVTVHNLNNLGREREKNKPLNCHQKAKETWISRISRFSKTGLKTVIHRQLTQSSYLVNGAEAELKCTVIRIQKRQNKCWRDFPDVQELRLCLLMQAAGFDL